MWPKLCNREVNVEKHIYLVLQGKLTFWKLALALVGFSWCAWNFFESLG